MNRGTPFFYGWVIVGIALISLISMILVYGIRHSFSVFFPHILNEFGWSRADISFMFSLNIFAYGLLSPVAGSLLDHWRLRRTMPIGISLLGLATAGCAFSDTLWHFYIFFGFLMPLGSAFIGSPVLYPTLMNWFTQKRGLVLGLSQMGAGLSFVYGIFVEFIISKLGWQGAYFVLGGILIVFLLPLNLLFFYDRPVEKNLKPFGAKDFPLPEDLPQNKSSAEGSLIRQSNVREVLKAPQLWYLVASHALYWGISAYLVLAHQVKFTQELGYSGIFSVSVFGLFGIAMCMGQSFGFLSDWIGREKTATLAASLSIAALCVLLSVQDNAHPFLLYMYAIGFGFGVGLFTPTIYASAADIFYNRHYGLVAGLMHTGMGIGGLIGPWLGGYLFDRTGSYRSAFTICILSMIFACLSIWGAAPRKMVKAEC